MRVQGSLSSQAVQGGGHQLGNPGIVALQSAKVVANRCDGRRKQDQPSKLDSISRQREARRSSDSAAEGESGEGVRAKTVDVRVSVVPTRNLVSLMRQSIVM